MIGFKLDTSGRVAGNFEGLAVWYEWDDLSPFAQGYIEAAFESLGRWLVVRNYRGHVVAFRDLAPATLAAMLEDCERALRPELARDRQSQDSGAAFWALRQSGTYADPHSRQHFPPLRLFLDDAGLIHQEVRR